MAKRLCEVCRKDVKLYCTNSRCQECHARYCTDGGNTSPGHGRGYPPKRVK